MLIQDKLTKIRNKRGFTLVELMIVVAIIGVLAALAIYGVRKYLTNAKTAEARTALGRLAKDVTVAYEKESVQEGVIPVTETAEIAHRLCSDAAPVPAAMADVQNKKYQSTPDDWKSPAVVASTGNNIPGGWTCLRFTMDSPQYYQYEYTYAGDHTSPAVVGDTFEVIARGDLDGDGAAFSELSMQGAIQADPVSSDPVLTLAATISETDIEE